MIAGEVHRRLPHVVESVRVFEHPGDRRPLVIGCPVTHEELRETRTEPRIAQPVAVIQDVVEGDLAIALVEQRVRQRIRIVDGGEGGIAQRELQLRRQLAVAEGLEHLPRRHDRVVDAMHVLERAADLRLDGVVAGRLVRSHRAHADHLLAAGGGGGEEEGEDSHRRASHVAMPSET